MKRNFEDIQKLIQSLTGVDPDTYSRMQFEYAYDFIERYVGDDDWAISYLTNSQTFWAWWRKQWALRDEVVISKLVRRNRSQRYGFRLWKFHHHPSRLVATPPVDLIHITYARMVGQVHDEYQLSNQTCEL